MPELPELQALAEGLTLAVAGRVVEGARLHGPATLKTADPPLEALVGRRVEGVRRRGKILVVEHEGGLALVIHLMQAGRLGLVAAGARRPGRTAALDLDHQLRRNDRGRGVGPHASRVRPFVTVKCALVVLARFERNDRPAVG